jgi:hypothetical protein
MNLSPDSVKAAGIFLYGSARIVAFAHWSCTTTHLAEEAMRDNLNQKQSVARGQ